MGIQNKRRNLKAACKQSGIFRQEKLKYRSEQVCLALNPTVLKFLWGFRHFKILLKIKEVLFIKINTERVISNRFSTRHNLSLRLKRKVIQNISLLSGKRCYTNAP